MKIVFSWNETNGAQSQLHALPTCRVRYAVGRCCYCDRLDPRDQLWPHHWHCQSNRMWHWMAGRCSSIGTCRCRGDCPMSKNRIYCSRHSANIGSSIPPFPSFQMMPIASPTIDNTGTPKSSSIPANMDSFGSQNIVRHPTEWLWFADLFDERERERKKWESIKWIRKPNHIESIRSFSSSLAFRFASGFQLQSTHTHRIVIEMETPIRAAQVDTYSNRIKKNKSEDTAS